MEYNMKTGISAQVEKLGIILSPTENTFENNGVLNPGIFQEDETVHIFYRAVEEGNFSTVGYAKSKGPFEIIERLDHPLITRDFEYEKHGVEDPRIVKIDELYYLTYTAYNGINAMGAVSVGRDLQHFEKLGIITPPLNYKEYRYHLECCNQELLNPKYYNSNNLFDIIGLLNEDHRLVRDKDIVLFPKKINGDFVMLHRLWPGIQIVRFKKFEDLTKEFWQNYIQDLTSHIVLDPLHDFEVNYLGAGCPPIETEFGWLLIYHGVCETTVGKTYHAAAALLDKDDPKKVLGRLPYPLFTPLKKYEMEGVVNHVVFPTGTALFDDDLYIYYGAADKYIAVAKVSLKMLLSELLQNKV